MSRRSPLPLLFLVACGGGAAEEETATLSSGVKCTPQEFCYHDNDHDGLGAGQQILSCDCHNIGYSFNNTDCNDNDAGRWHYLSCFTDADGDHHAAGNAAQVCAGATCESVPGKYSQADDCNDSDAARWHNLPCYTDNDGDHYGTGVASTVCVGLTCGDGVSHKAESAGDCNDGNASIHPHTLEIASNNVDENCENGPDEAIPSFYLNGNGNTVSSFQIKLTLNSAAEIAFATGANLHGKVYYRKLENASAPFQVTPMAPATVVGSTAEFTVSGLEELKVYEARVDLYQIYAYLTIPGQPSEPLYRRIAPLSGCTGDSSSTPTPCSNSSVYYTITLPSGTDTIVKTARVNVVLSALYENHYFRTHPLGSWDDSLQDRYQLAARDSAYCSEFYANAAQPYLVDMNPCQYRDATSTPQCDPSDTSTGEYFISLMKNWFSAYSNGFELFESDPGFVDRKPGDWLGVNPVSASPDGQHTQMFLAYDAASQKYWFVEGNGGYSNAWGALAHTSNVSSASRCDSSGWYCPPNAAALCSTGCFYIKSVGKLANSNMVD